MNRHTPKKLIKSSLDLILLYTFASCFLPISMTMGDPPPQMGAICESVILVELLKIYIHEVFHIFLFCQCLCDTLDNMVLFYQPVPTHGSSYVILVPNSHYCLVHMMLSWVWFQQTLSGLEIKGVVGAIIPTLINTMLYTNFYNIIVPNNILPISYLVIYDPSSSSICIR